MYVRAETCSSMSGATGLVGGVAGSADHRVSWMSAESNSLPSGHDYSVTQRAFVASIEGAASRATSRSPPKPTTAVTAGSRDSTSGEPRRRDVVLRVREGIDVERLAEIVRALGHWDPTRASRPSRLRQNLKRWTEYPWRPVKAAMISPDSSRAASVALASISPSHPLLRRLR